MTWHAKAFGENALLFELAATGAGPRMEARRARALATKLRARFPDGDIVVGGASVLLDHETLPGDLSFLVEAEEEPLAAQGARRTIDVVYDGVDLASIANDLGCSTEAVIQMHLAPEYEVEVLGFLPGFAYLGEVDPALQRPRRATPRRRVPALSVGIAGRYSGVYPSASPGGWHLLGTAGGVRLFDPSADPPVLMQPGERVRFQRVERHAGPPSEIARAPVPDAVIEVLLSPPHATIQDLGRPRMRGEGIPTGGAWDVETDIATNRALGNEDGCATLELPLDRFRGRVLSDLWYSVDGDRARHAKAGDEIEIAPSSRAVRYLGIAGGFAAEEALGSRSTLLAAGIGGLEGRRIRKGDRLARVSAAATRCLPAETSPEGGAIEVVPGPHVDRFAPSAFERLLETEFTVSASLDRTGARLEGGRIERRDQDAGAPMPMIRGAIQVSTDGTPIVLGPDGATTGGYPVIGVVRRGSQSKLARLRPGDRLRFAT